MFSRWCFKLKEIGFTEGEKTDKIRTEGYKGNKGVRIGGPSLIAVGNLGRDRSGDAFDVRPSNGIRAGELVSEDERVAHFVQLASRRKPACCRACGTEGGGASPVVQRTRQVTMSLSELIGKQAPSKVARSPIATPFVTFVTFYSNYLFPSVTTGVTFTKQKRRRVC